MREVSLVKWRRELVHCSSSAHWQENRIGRREFDALQRAFTRMPDMEHTAND